MLADRRKPPALKLEDLIDLELQFQADRERDGADLRRRDATIGQTIDARGLAEAGRDREMFLAWLRRIREMGDPHRATPGRQMKLFLEVVGLVLVLLGIGLGFGAVTGWLRMDPTEPVNAIFFWVVIVGIQVLLLLVWLIAVLPAGWLRRLPGFEAVQFVLRAIARGLPLAVAWIAARMSPEHRLLLARVRGTLESWGWIYGKVRFWKLIGLTQLFAVAYNAGAILAFVAISYGNDPAFGWKSRLLTPGELHGIVRTIAWPWHSMWPAAAPTLESIEVTRFSSLDPRFHEAFQSRGGEVDAWVLWWPFLMACLLCYGLIPRLVTLAISHWSARRAMEKIRLDHGDFYKLKDRLTRPLVETQAVTPEVQGPAASEATAPAPRMEVKDAQIENLTKGTKEKRSKSVAIGDDPRPSGGGYEEQIEERTSVAKAKENSREEETTQQAAAAQLPVRRVVQWAGVNLDRESAGRLVRQRLGVEAGEIFTVGDLQGKGDELALRALQNGDRGEVLMVVESWEPPIADYVDFLSDMRAALGRERMIVVLLYNRDREGQPSPPRPRDAKIWRDQMATLGDPWLCVEELVASG